ncbi:MAG: CYTH domain-containing protein [Sporomusaceae bacterium]|nr:CYTH domain-containing protein [Sporomusaceae bacterium]
MSNIESELKLRLADPDDLKNLFRVLKEFTPQEAREEKLATTYYDTAGYHLLKAGLSYRLRHSHAGITATVKADGQSDGGLHRRLEFNAPVRKGLPDITPFLAVPVGGRLKAAVGAAELIPICGTSFARYILDLTLPDGSEIELAVDCGEITAAAKTVPLLEIELELKQGSYLALIKLGAELAQRIPLLIELESKLARAVALGGIELKFPSENKTAAAPLPVALLYSLINEHQLFLLEPNADNLTSLKTAWRKLDPELAALKTAAVKTRPLATFFASEDKDIGKIHKLLASGWATPIFLNLWAYLEENIRECQTPHRS